MGITGKDVMATGGALSAAAYFVPEVSSAIGKVASSVMGTLSIAPLVGGAMGFGAGKIFGASNTTSSGMGLTSAGFVSGTTALGGVTISPLLMAGGLGMIAGKQAGKFLEFDEKQQRDLGIISGLSVAGLTALGVSAMPIAMGGVAAVAGIHGYNRLLKPTFEKAFSAGKNGLKNTVNWTTGTIKDMGHFATLQMFRKQPQPATA